MLKCWSVHPESRPLFDELVKSLGNLLANGVAEYYIGLNEPYVQMNATNFAERQTDYLAIMASPDRTAAPKYVNTDTQQATAIVSLPDYTRDTHLWASNSQQTSQGKLEEIPMSKRCQN